LKEFHLQNVPGGKGNAKVSYPVVFDLKVIVDSQQPVEQSKAHLMTVLSQNGVPSGNFRLRESSGGKYISLTLEVVMNSEETMKKVYIDLNTLPGIKLAL
jgi:putative lipoic acid-binding regulatory protein